MNTGKLNRRISYTAHGTYSDDGFGGKTLILAGATIETWCSARQLSMRESLLNGMPAEYKTFEFAFIYERGANIVSGTILTYESKTFRVISITETDEAKREIKVMATTQ